MENTIGERIANLRKKKGLTQLQLAEILKISDKAVSKWESNKGDPSLEMIVLLSETFNCTTDYLIKGIIQNKAMFKNISINHNKEIPYFEDLFYRAMEIVKNNISAISYELWVSCISPVKIEDEIFVLIVPTKIIKDHIRKVFETEILEALQRIDGRIKHIHILVEDLSTDTLLKNAVKIAIAMNSISASKIQAILMVGYPTAADLIFTMEYLGFISKRNEHNIREIYITKEKFEKEFKELWFED